MARILDRIVGEFHSFATSTFYIYSSVPIPLTLSWQTNGARGMDAPPRSRAERLREPLDMLVMIKSEGMRLDLYVLLHLGADFSRSEVQRAIEAGYFSTGLPAFSQALNPPSRL